MYHFMLHGLTCHCDSAVELRTVSEMLAKERAMEQSAAPKDGVKRAPIRIIAEIAGQLGKPMEWWTSEAEGPLKKVKSALESIANEKAAELVKKKGQKAAKKAVATKKAKKKREARYSVNLSKTPQELKDIPYVKGGITWAVANRIAKKLGRDDIAQMRSDLAQRKKLPK